MQGMQVNAALDSLLDGGRGVIDATGKIYGVVPALVKAIHDPKQKRHMQGMVQIFFPWLQSDQDKAKIMPWARCLMPGTGGGAGFYSVPQIGDEVCVGFEHGDIHFPYVLGALWNGKDKIPAPTTDADKQDCKGNGDGAPTYKTPDLGADSISGDKGTNKIVFMRSRTGNLLAMDDKNGVVRTNDRSGNSAVQLENGKIQMMHRTGDIMVFAAKTIRFDCETFEVHAKKDISFDAGKDWGCKAKVNINIEADAKLSITAKAGIGFSCKADITFVAQGAVTMTAAQGISLKSSSAAAMIMGASGVTIIGGSEVNIKGPKVNVVGAAGVTIGSAAEITIKAGGNLTGTANCINLN